MLQHIVFLNQLKLVVILVGSMKIRLIKILEKNISSLKLGEITKPIILSNGILILKLINTKNSETTIDIENELKKSN